MTSSEDIINEEDTFALNHERIAEGKGSADVLSPFLPR
jgi:hypothetical protein